MTRNAAWKERVDGADWAQIAAETGEFGCALTPELLTQAECARIAGLYDRDEMFRSTVDMARYRFGEGEYLSEPGADHTGGEFLLLEQRPRPSPAARPRSSRTGAGWCSPPGTAR